MIKAGRTEGTFFTVWAPNAEAVSVIGDFNGWQKNTNPLVRIKDSGYWHGFVPGVAQGALYKYVITSRIHNYQVRENRSLCLSL